MTSSFWHREAALDRDGVKYLQRKGRQSAVVRKGLLSGSFKLNYAAPTADQSSFYFIFPRKRNALVMTEAELKLIAKAATMGDRSKPVNGNNRPAAKGTPSEL